MKPDDILPELKQGGGETIDQGGQETKKIATSGKPKKEKLPDPEGDFVVAPCTEPKYFLKLQREELKANLELFSENEKDLVQKFISGTLDPKEMRRFPSISDAFWEKKKVDSISCRKQEDRKIFLERKYGSYKKFMDQGELQKELITAFGANDEKKICHLRGIYESRFQGQIEGVEGLLSLNDYFNNQKRIDEIPALRANIKKETKALEDEIVTLREQIIKAEEDDAGEKNISELKDNEQSKRNKYEKLYLQNKILKMEQQGLIVDEAAYQALLTDFIKNNPDKKEFLARFWNLAREIGQAKKDLPFVERLRAAVLSQVAIYHTLDKLGLEPRIAHPEKDAKNQIDFETNRGVTQVKGTPGLTAFEEISEMKIEGSRKIILPASTANTPQGNAHFTDIFSAQCSSYREAIDEYQKRTGKKELAFIVAIPHKEMDGDTGVPSDIFLKFAENRLREILESIPASQAV